MDRIIEIKVNGNYLTKDNRYAGVQHEANMTALRIEFDDGWDGFAKTITWWDATGENPVEIILGADRLENVALSTRIYLVLIPGEALAESGECSFVIDGFIDGKRQRSVEDHLTVMEAAYAEDAGQPADPTPTQAEQLQKEIESVVEDVQAAAQSARAILGMTVEAETLGPGSEATVEKTENEAGALKLTFGLPRGEKGERGLQGEQGVKGDKGDTGATGPRGERGLTGPKGEQGPRGMQGERGEQGPRGVQGAQGPQGPQGVKGDKGEQGATGPRGAQGVQGVKGDKGDRGEKGETGADGLPGATGPRGEQGVQGVQGPRGEAGPQGATGPRGEQGVPGKIGERGEQGVQGPAGEVGPQGIQGIQGAQGLRGEVGPQGPQGEIGPQGPQGIQGPEGPRGFSGVMVETAGYVNFSVTEDGILQCTYTGNEAPDYSINVDGHLILTV